MTAPAGRFVPRALVRRGSRTSRTGRTCRPARRIVDLFGNGKTAVKGNVGLYIESEATGFANTYNPQIFAMDTRTWNDSEP
jgi:hypothetical protein